jgi:predicted RecB family nuclease
VWAQAKGEAYRADGIKRLVAEVPDDERVVALPTEILKTATWRIAIDLQVRVQNFETWIPVVERAPSAGRGKAAQFIPIRFVWVNKVSRHDKLLLAFDALALSYMLGRDVPAGKIIHGDDHAVLKVKTSGLVSEARTLIEKTATMLSAPLPPDLILNRYCAECEFQTHCRQKAVERDDLSLLALMPEKERKKFHSKGIFTVTQLSYTFRPRRRPKRQRDKREKYHHALKALAIREKKIHVVDSPELNIAGTPVYLDVEGLPDRDFYYLIGVRIGKGEAVVQHSMWADTVEGERTIWNVLIGILGKVEKPVLIHYGSYETVFLRRMCERYGEPLKGSEVAEAIRVPVNLLAMTFARVYFPTFSNGLKEIAGYLGFQWSDSAATGIQSH